MTRGGGRGRRTILALVAASLLVVLVPAEVANAAPTQVGPAEVAGPVWKQFSTGYYHTCAVRTSGRLFCFGQDDHGELGNGGPNASSSTPVEVDGAATDWKSVSAGSHTTCAIKTKGTLWCWGRDDFGQIGNGPITGNQAVPVQVGAATDWKSVSAGLGETVCGRRADKRIYCWGRDNNGQAGNGPSTFSDVLVPTAVGTSADWSSVSTGGLHVCGRRSNSRIYCWGDDQDGAVGDGGTAPGTDRSVPTQVAGNHADWTSVSAGLTHTCGRRTSGRIYCFGSDIDGGIGNGAASSASVFSPVQVNGNATDWKAVNAGGYVSCATKTSGRLFCWGGNAYGQVGTGTADPTRPVPVQVTGNVTTWKPATTGNYHTCALRTDSRLFCWGYGFFGQRGDGQVTQIQPTPAEVS